MREVKANPLFSPSSDRVMSRFFKLGKLIVASCVSTSNPRLFSSMVREVMLSFSVTYSNSPVSAYRQWLSATNKSAELCTSVRLYPPKMRKYFAGQFTICERSAV